MPGAPRLQQPSHSTIGGDPCHVWASGGRLRISIHGAPPADPYAVADGLDDRVLGPPNPRAVTPATMPEFWAETGTP